MKMNSMIGIVGGMGPYAGVRLHELILKNSHASRDQDHLPVVHLNRASDIPDRTDFLLGRGAANPSGAIIQQVQFLISAGATVIGLPCNTTHAPKIFNPIVSYFNRTGAHCKLVNMIEEVMNDLTATGIRKVGLLATLGTYETGLYSDYGERYGIEVLNPAADLKDAVHDCIYNPVCGIKALGALSAECRRGFDEVFDFYARHGIDTLIMGCTEITMAFPVKHENFTMIDTLDILACSLVREAETKEDSDNEEG